MKRPQRFGKYGSRGLFVLDLDGPGLGPGPLRLPSPRVVVLLAWDARKRSVAEIVEVVTPLLDRGAVYFCCWGLDCERVHDIVDEVDLERNPDFEETGTVMTSWHDDETLEDAIEFALLAAWPDTHYEAGCDTTLGLAIGDPTWAVTMREAFRDPKTFLANRPDE